MKKEAIMWGVFFLLAMKCASADMRINEMMYNPQGNDNNKEFIELYLDSPENLSGYIISDLASNDTLELVQYSDSNYALIVEEGFDITGINASVYSAGATIGNNLDNTADEIFFYTPVFTQVASAQYDGTIANNNGYSIELVGGEWIESTELGGTPGRQNTAVTESDPGNETGNETGNSGIDFIISTDKDIYDNNEKVKIDFDIEPEQDDFIIEYWIEDLAGNIAKDKYNTTNSNQKSWTPNIDESDRSFYVMANLYSGAETIFSKSLFTVIGESKPNESSISIKDVLLGTDESIEFGKSLRTRLDIYKADESSNTVEIWIEDLDSKEKISEVSKLTLYEKFKRYDLTIPVQIKNNCNGDYPDGSYTLVVSGFDLIETEEVRVDGIVSSICPEAGKKASSESEKTDMIDYELIECPEEAVIGEEFNTRIKITNDDESHDFTLWSYVYRGSKSYSGEREENKVTINLGSGQEEVIELVNMVKEAEPGEYKLKVKIQKDDLKTTNDFTKDVLMEYPIIEENRSINLEVQTIVDSVSASNSTGMQAVTGDVAYRSASAKAKDLTPYFMIASIAVIIFILLVNKKKKWKKRMKKPRKKQIRHNNHQKL